MHENMMEKENDERQKIKEGLEEAKQKMRDNYHRMGEKASEIRGKTNKYIIENPEKSMLMAAGFGALIAAFLLGARRRRRY